MVIIIKSTFPYYELPTLGGREEHCGYPIEGLVIRKKGYLDRRHNVHNCNLFVFLGLKVATAPISDDSGFIVLNVLDVSSFPSLKCLSF